MTGIAAGVLLFGSFGLLGLWSNRLVARRRAIDRLERADASREVAENDVVRGRGRTALAVALAFAAVFLAARFLLSAPVTIAAALGVDGAVVAGLAVATVHERRAARIEAQLAELLQLSAASLRAGMGRVDAFDRALAQIGDPLAAVLSDPFGRLRLGESPERVFGPVVRQIPLESFRLFALVLSTQWNAGGSLQNTLGSIGESLQDRVDVTRRIQSQSAPIRSSVLTLIAATAAIAYFSYANDPPNLERFLRSEWGEGLVASAFVLQGLSLVWIWQMTRTRN